MDDHDYTCRIEVLPGKRGIGGEQIRVARRRRRGLGLPWNWKRSPIAKAA